MSKSYEKKYFAYKGKYYGYGTVVKLKPQVYAGLVRIENCGGIMEFHKGYTNGNYQFRIVTDYIYHKSSIFLKDPLENSIESIVKPIEVIPQSALQNALENFAKTPKGTRPDVTQGTIIFIAVLLLTAIFKDRMGLWILETIFYIVYLINAYRD